MPKSGYLSHQTIVALSTQVGGALSIFRMTGESAFILLQKLTRSESALSSEPAKLVRSPFYLPSGAPLDDALFVRFVAPQSYTGENLVELHTHGSSYIAQRILDTLLSYGARLALPGEFSFRAVRNGKMTLFQAEALPDLIRASNDGALGLALEKMTGSQNAQFREWSQTLKQIAALSEVGIDFSDQNVDETSLETLKKELLPLLEAFQQLESSFRRGVRLQEGVRVACVGLPNAGKSSFFNALLGEDRSIVSELEGTTRDLIREHLTLTSHSRSVTLRLEDTAGLRLTDHPVEKIGIQKTYQATQEADLLLWVVHPEHPWDAVVQQWEALSKGQHSEILPKTLVILTHLDQLHSNTLVEVEERLKQLGFTEWVALSSVTGVGISEAIEKILVHVDPWVKRTPGEIVLTKLEHCRAIQQTLEHLNRALLAETLDLFAADIRQALYALGPLIGEVVPDDILGEIFSRFCIGK